MWKIIFAVISVATLFIGVDCSGKSMKISEAWSRATPADATSADVYLKLENHMGEADTLTGVTTYIAETSSIITTTNVNGISETRTVPILLIAENKEITLLPGRSFIHLDKLKQPLKAGDTFPLTLTFEKGGQVLEDVTVQPAGTLTYP
jgi:periplasmic copper chaperone A